MAGRKRVRACRTQGTSRLRAFNAGKHSLAPVGGAVKPSALRDVSQVLSGDGNGHAAASADARTATTVRTDAKPVSGHSSPLRVRRLVRGEVLKARGRLAPSPRVSTADPVVVDNFGKAIRVTRAELRVFETYFGDILDELFGSSKTG